jgi:O-antigen/teichoic acid export membrane protein
VRLIPFDANGDFYPASDDAGMRRLAAKGVGATVLSQGLSFGVQLASTIVLVRLFTPESFGLIAMVTAFSMLVMNCGYAGLADAVLQREELNHRLASNLFWINSGVGLALTLGFAASGPLLSKFYGEPRLTYIAAVASLSILATSLSVLPLSLLRRAMWFSSIAANDIAARTIGVVVSILLGLAGWGYWALLAGVIAQPLSTLIGVWALCRWIPSAPSRVRGTASVLWFAVSIYGRWGLGYFSQNTDNILIGWRFGKTPLGYYKKAYDLFILPFSLLSIYPVAVSTLSRLTKNAEQYKRYLLGGLSMLALVGMGIGATLTLVGKDVVRLVLGSAWGTTGEIFGFFGPGIGALIIYGTNGMVHISLGTKRRYLWWGIIEATVMGVMFVVALPWGPKAMALSWTAAYWILLVPSLWYAGQPVQLGITAVIRAIWKFAAASLLAGIVVALILKGMPGFGEDSGYLASLVRILITSTVFSGLYIIAIVLLHGGLTPFRQFAAFLKDMIPDGRMGKWVSRPIERFLVYTRSVS